MPLLVVCVCLVAELDAMKEAAERQILGMGSLLHPYARLVAACAPPLLCLPWAVCSMQAGEWALPFFGVLAGWPRDPPRFLPIVAWASLGVSPTRAPC